MHTHYFPEIKHPIPFEGTASKNPLAFKWYKAAHKVRGKTMAEHLKFAIAYWHTLQGTGADPFGGGVYDRPWHHGKTPLDTAERTLDAAFEFFTKIGARYWCFHDTDIAPEGASLKELAHNLDHIVTRACEWQKATGIRALWGTANLFSHARYTHGAATNPDPKVMACAATQVRHAIDATVALGGTGYVFWGGREGYACLLNTRLQQEREQLAAFLHMAVAYGKSAGFKGTYFIEPKPREPSKHQYDYDAASVLGFLREFDLLPFFQLNIEANHATLAGHDFAHDLQVASAAGKLGSLDINQGDPTCGWDTDEFPTDIRVATGAMLVLLRQGGLKHGGLNFDAKVRRGSFDTVDLFHGHISGMDTFARALLIADRILSDGILDKLTAERYAGYQTPMGRKIQKGRATLPELEKWVHTTGEPQRISGRQEYIERLFNEYIWNASF